MGKADTLSRREDHAMGIEKDNTGILVISPEQISSIIEVCIATDADIIIDTIKDILFDLKEPDLIPLRKQYVLNDQTFYDENGKIYVPNDQALCLDSSNYTTTLQSQDTQVEKRHWNSSKEAILGVE